MNLLGLLKAGKGSSLFVHFGLNNLFQIKDQALYYQFFLKHVPIQALGDFPATIRQMFKDKLTPLMALVVRVGVLKASTTTPLGVLVYQGSWIFWPMTQMYCTQLQQRFARFQQGQPAFYVFDFMLPNKMMDRAQEEDALLLPPLLEGLRWQGVWLSKLLGRWSGAPLFVNQVDELRDQGRSQQQLFYTLYQQAKRDGKAVKMLVAHPRTLQNFCLFVAQQAGRYVALKELFPALEVYVSPTPSLEPYRVPLDYCFNGQRLAYRYFGVEDPVSAVQTDANVMGYLSLPEAGVFYEFIPEEDIRPDGTLAANFRTYDVQETQVDRIYAVLASFAGGLLRQNLNLRVRLVNKHPLEVLWQGELSPLNVFGDALPHQLCCAVLHDLNEILHSHGLFIRDFIVGHHTKQRQYHWMIELSRPIPQVNRASLLMLAQRLHKELELRHQPYRKALTRGQMLPPSVSFYGIGSFLNITPLQFSQLKYGVYDVSADQRIAKILTGQAAIAAETFESHEICG